MWRPWSYQCCNCRKFKARLECCCGNPKRARNRACAGTILVAARSKLRQWVWIPVWIWWFFPWKSHNDNPRLPTEVIAFTGIFAALGVRKQLCLPEVCKGDLRPFWLCYLPLKSLSKMLEIYLHNCIYIYIYTQLLLYNIHDIWFYLTCAYVFLPCKHVETPLDQGSWPERWQGTNAASRAIPGALRGERWSCVDPMVCIGAADIAHW